MKKSHALALATTLTVAAAAAPGALAASSKPTAHLTQPTLARVSLGGGEDDGGALPGGRVAHGTIGKAPPSANAATSLRSLGGDDGGSDDGGALPGGRTAHGTIGKAPPSAKAAKHLRALRGSDG